MFWEFSMTFRQRIFMILAVIILTVSVLELITDSIEQRQSLNYQIEEALDNLEHAAEVSIGFDENGPVQNQAESIPFDSRVRVLEGNTVQLTLDQSTSGAMFAIRNKGVTKTQSLELAVDIRTYRAVLMNSFWRDLRYDFINILLALGLAWWISGWVLRPLQALVQSMTEANQAKHPQSVNVSGMGDELSDLAISFNQAVDAARLTLEREKMLMRYTSREIAIPLGDMSSHIESLAMGALPEERVVPLVQRNLERMQHVLRTLPNLSQTAPSGAHPISLITLLKETIHLIPDSQQYRIGLKISTSSNPKVTHPALVAQCVLSLLDNALQSKGEVKVTLESYEAKVRVRIEDYGLGVAEEQIAQFKQPLTSFPTLVDDSLLRLAFVKHMIQNLEGTLDIRNTGRGLEVLMTLPIATSSALTQTQERLPSVTQIGGKAKETLEKVAK
jgi:signal transduction histidine kinase